MLVVCSAGGSPFWASAIDTIAVSVGECDFSCCQRGHIITTATQKNMGDGGKVAACDKPIVRSILKPLLDAKVAHHFGLGDTTTARYFYCMDHWFLRGLPEPEKDAGETLIESGAVAALKRGLRWGGAGEDGGQTSGWTLLLYAALSNDVAAVAELARAPGSKWMVNKGLRSKGHPKLSMAGGGTPLIVAMAFAGPEVVCSLLEAGADPQTCDANGMGPVMVASACGRTELVSLWLEHHPKWDLERRGKLFGKFVMYILLNFIYLDTETKVCVLPFFICTCNE